MTLFSGEVSGEARSCGGSEVCNAPWCRIHRYPEVLDHLAAAEARATAAEEKNYAWEEGLKTYIAEVASLRAQLAQATAALDAAGDYIIATPLEGWREPDRRAVLDAIDEVMGTIDAALAGGEE